MGPAARGSDDFAGRLVALAGADRAVVEAEAALAAGGRVALADLPPGATTLVVAALARRRPVLVVAPSEDLLPGLDDDLRALLAPAEGDGGPGAQVVRNPPLDAALRDGAPEDEGLDDDPEDDGPEDDGPEDVARGATVGGRLRVLEALRQAPTGPPGGPVVLSGVSALLERVPEPVAVAEGVREVRAGERLDPHALVADLVRVGYTRVPLVEAPGEVALRGGILDVFPLGAAAPVRVELWGDEVEGLRRFEPGSQRSIEPVARVVLPLVSPQAWVRLRRQAGASLLAHLPPGAVVVLLDPARARARLAQAATLHDPAVRRGDLLPREGLEAALARAPLLLAGEGADDDPLAARAARPETDLRQGEVPGGPTPAAVADGLAQLVRRGERLTVTCLTDAEREHLGGLLRGSGLAPVDDAPRLRGLDDPPGVTLLTFPFDGALRAPARGAWVLAAHRLFARRRRGEVGAPRGPRGARRPAASTPVESFADLEPGEHVVHVTHGIALFRGIVRRERDGVARDYLELELDGGTLAIPTDRIGLIRRYVGPDGARPRLSKLGGAGWRNKTKRAAEAVKDLAAELLEVQAARRVLAGHAFPPDGRSQALFEESFGWADTDDQARVTEEVKRDMERPAPMDRLVCGDVGYGKTEIAVRAAFKCLEAGRQVAVLVPTTVLAHQHLRTFQERMAAYPFRLEALSRFRTPAETRDVLRGLASGEVGLVIGTHRLLSRDLAFHDLGLVVIDEEQRFGVEHKERLKSLRRSVDVLTLSATPIPRTLHLALSGARDISVLQTPPPGRAPVETRVARSTPALVRRAIERELARDGQVFVVHDRVKSIDRLAHDLRALVPQARVAVVHGQLPEQELEARMLAFVEHEVDVLVATTLIENGLDIRRANTILVDRAHRYGLAELHQLRGRVGRADVRAYAWFLVPEDGTLTDVALRRLRAIEELRELGAGFQIALRDLEIRGAGNVLGAEQSGHMADVGYDLYCRLLKRAMAELRGELTGRPLDLERDLDLEAAEVELVLDVEGFVPDAYVADVALKIDCYRRLAQAACEDDLAALELELRDRFGPVPAALATLFDLRRARLRAAGHGVLRVSRQDKVLQLRCRSARRLQAAVRARRQALRPIDAHMLYLVLPDPGCDDAALLALLLEVLPPVDARGPDEGGPEVDLGAARRERQRRQRARAFREQTDGLRPGPRRPR